jgi:hypothetical protein
VDSQLHGLGAITRHDDSESSKSDWQSDDDKDDKSDAKAPALEVEK